MEGLKWILRIVTAVSLLTASFFLSLIAYVFLVLWLLCLKGGYYETGSGYVWLLIVPGLIPHGLVVWLISKSWGQLKLIGGKRISREEVKTSIKVLYCS